jgi:FtsH-binding integral membrane protein
VFGFAHIVRDKEKALRKQTNNAWLVELKRFLTLPKLAFTAALAAALYTVGTLMNADLRLWLIVSLWIIGTICQATKLVQFRKQKRRQLMLTQHHPIAVFAPVVLFFDNLIFLPQTFNSPLGFAIWGVFAVLMQATMFTVTKNIFSKARELYPEAFQMQRLSNN